MKLTKKKKVGLTSVIGLIALLTYQDAAHAISTTAQALQVVISALSITKVSDLDFGTAPQGDALKVVAPGVAEAADNASFTVAGAPNTAYTITLPVNGLVKMITAGGGAANKEINVNDFLSYPAATGMLDGSGNQLLLVGASRDALLVSQLTGSYAGTFTVAVVY